MRFLVLSSICIFTAVLAVNYPSLFSSILKLVNSTMQYSPNEPADTMRPLADYDFIIVGAGSAGAVLANRLTEIPDWNVLLIEAGGPELMMMDVPFFTPFLQPSSANWQYYGEPTKNACLGLIDGRCPLPRGKVMGGSSVLNFMVYARGDARDYDNWEAMGNKGWSWNEVFPYFKKSEDLLIKDDWVDPKAHGHGGYLSVDTLQHKTPLVHAFVKAGAELGYKVSDYNDGDVSGFSYVQTTTNNGSRMSTSRSFLHPIKDRKNLCVVKYGMATKILLEKNRAVGVEYVKNNRKFTIRAKREVIVSAGAINTPQLLMLSGIGPRSHLHYLGIKAIRNLPVGYNLMDHPVIGYVIFTVDKPVSEVKDKIKNLQPLKDYLQFSGGLEGVAFVDVDGEPDVPSFPNLELHFSTPSPLSMPFLNKIFHISDEIYREVYDTKGKRIYSYLMFMAVSQPKSRGRITLRNTDPFSKPIIDTGFLNHPDDVEILVKGVEFSKNISNTKAFEEFNPIFFDRPIPHCAHFGRDTNEYWACHARHLTISNYHQCGTAKMGPKGDQTAVVDPRLRVHGIKRLRVIDASVMPMITSANTNAPVIMIAEKGADMIKEDWKKI